MSKTPDNWKTPGQVMGAMGLRLSDYKVQAFVRVQGQLRRIPMEPERIKAISERGAIATYARCHRVPKEDWDSPSPKVLILCMRESAFEQSRDGNGALR